MDSAPYTVYAGMSAVHAFKIFRGLGLRHLTVIAPRGTIVGVITRHDLTEDAVESALDNRH